MHINMATITDHKNATIFYICPIVIFGIAQFTRLKKKNVKY